MDFTIIGAGNMGRRITTRLLSGKNSVVIMDRDNAEAQKLAEELRSVIKGNTDAKAAPMVSPITHETVILAVYYSQRTCHPFPVWQPAGWEDPCGYYQCYQCVRCVYCWG